MLRPVDPVWKPELLVEFDELLLLYDELLLSYPEDLEALALLLEDAGELLPYEDPEPVVTDPAGLR